MTDIVLLHFKSQDPFANRDLTLRHRGSDRYRHDGSARGERRSRIVAEGGWLFGSPAACHGASRPCAGEGQICERQTPAGVVKMGRRVESPGKWKFCKLDFCADFEDHPKRVTEMVSGVFSIAKLCWSCGLYRAGWSASWFGQHYCLPWFRSWVSPFKALFWGVHLISGRHPYHIVAFTVKLYPIPPFIFD